MSERKPGRLISRTHIERNLHLHGASAEWGDGGGKWAPLVRELARRLKAETVLDYGAGKRRLEHELAGELSVRSYDPAVPGIQGLPSPADIVTAFHVLTHVEPSCVDAVLLHIESLTRRAAVFVVGAAKSGKYYCDGQDTNLIQRPLTWWERKLSRPGWVLFRYEIEAAKRGELVSTGKGFRALWVAYPWRSS